MSSCLTRTKTILVPTKPEPCHVSAFPAEPTLYGTKDGCPEGFVCISEESAIEMGLWVRDATRYHKDAKACPTVEEAPQPLGTALNRWIEEQQKR